MITLTETLDQQQDLDSLCADRTLETNEIFTPNAYYGFDRVVKAYVGLPDDYVLKFVMPHGISVVADGFVWKAEVKSPLPTIFCYPEHLRHAYQVSARELGLQKEIFLTCSPFLYIRQILKNQDPPARCGTIFFPAHSTHHFRVQQSHEQLAEQLLLLEGKYQPVSVCIYWQDYLLGHHLPFQKAGFRIVSAGHIYDPWFLFRFYHLCSLHQYAVSNEIGSHVFYSVSSGCSYFQLGGFIPEYEVESNSPFATNSAIWSDAVPSNPSERIPYLRSLFRSRYDEITQEQREVIDYYVGHQYLKPPNQLKVEIAEAEKRYFELVESQKCQDQSQTGIISKLLSTAGVLKKYLYLTKRLVKASFEELKSPESSVPQQDPSDAVDYQSQATAIYESPRNSYLNLGCGGCFNPDWTNVDFKSTEQGVITYDLTQGIPFPHNSFTVVYHSHLLEHLPKSAAEPFLRECYRVLQPGGILRVVVPDLEQIARLYLTALEKASQGDREWAANYDWMLLEMYDQVVRDRSGGEMAAYLSQDPLPNEAFVLGRLGAEGERMLNKLRDHGRTAATNNPPTPEQVGEFRRCGEIHQWMYDRHSLGVLLAQAGFRDIRVTSALESRIPGFGQYHLDTTPEGKIRKADSLFMEAGK